MVDIGKRFWDLTEYSNWFEYSRPAIRSMCSALIDINMLVVADDDKIVGVAGGIVAPWPFNPELNAGAELFWYVDPEYRSSGAGLKMLRALESLAKNAGADIWSMISLDSVDPKKVEKMYLHSGYVPTERTYSKVL